MQKIYPTREIKASNAYGTTDTFLCIVIDTYIAESLCIDLYELTINLPFFGAALFLGRGFGTVFFPKAKFFMVFFYHKNTTPSAPGKKGSRWQ